MKITQTSDLWWKTAVIYCLDVETYLDSDGDGIGDLTGLARRIDYLADLGVTCLWLMPFYPSPDRDDGYDITDYYGVDERLGSLGDLVEVIRTAQDRGIRVIADLVVNHTSDRHPWFRAARSSTSNPYRDYYVWRSDPPPDTDKQVIFPDQEDSIWEHDERTDEWFLHRFYKHQPDLNVTNPAVRDEISKVIGLWLKLGLTGFRVDAVPFLLDPSGTSEQDADRFGDSHSYLRSLRSFLMRRKGSGVLLGEVNLPYQEQVKYFGGTGNDGGDELTMQFDFIGMQNLYLALARSDAAPLTKALKSRPVIPAECQWGNFVRNHDELTLDKLSESERQEVFAAFGPEERMQIYGRGIKRRLPPMLNGDPRRIRMVYSLLFSLPGTPVLFYGEEIGMGEDLEAEGRLAVRTPMQWSAGPNAGFSTARPAKLASPVVSDGYGPRHVNVADQRRDPDSLWTFISRLIRRYRDCPELGWGDMVCLSQPEPAVLAHECRLDGSRVLAVHNLSADPVTARITVPEDERECVLVDLLERDDVRIDGRAEVEIPLPGYGFVWLRPQADEPVPG